MSLRLLRSADGVCNVGARLLCIGIVRRGAKSIKFLLGVQM